MPLTPLQPFERERYLGEVAGFTDWVVDRLSVPACGRRGWGEHLSAYRWQGDDLREGLDKRRRLAARLRSATDRQGKLEVVQAVARWGRMSPFSEADGQAVIETLPRLDELAAGGTEWRRLHPRRIAATSKVYAVHDLDSWAIYDSRVARALAWLAHAWRQETSDCLEERLGFRVPEPRGTRGLPPGFKALGHAATQQARLGFVYASWLLVGVADTLAASSVSSPAGEWRLPQIEMVMFVLGGEPDEALAALQRGGSANRLDRQEVSELGLGAVGPILKPAAKVVAAKAAQHAAETLPRAALDSGKGAASKALSEKRAAAKARKAAVKFAKQTNGVAREAMFPDGVSRWVVFDGREPLAEFPSYDGDLRRALRRHDIRRLGRRFSERLQANEQLHRAGRWLGQGIGKAWDAQKAKKTREMVERLDAKLADDREAAALDLGARGDTSAVPALIGTLNDKVARVRAAAAVSLGDLGDPIADRPLARSLADDDETVRCEAAAALGDVRGDDGAEELIAILRSDSSSPELRANAASSLGALESEHAVEPLEDALANARTATDAEAMVRSQAAHALAQLGGEVAVRTLIAGLGDSAASVRESCVLGLGELGDPEAIPPIEAAVEDRDRAVAESAYVARQALGEASGLS